MPDNFYWITGDPYFIVEAKNNLIKKISSNKEEDYESVNISDLETIEEIVSEVSGNPLFGSNKKKIFVYNGQLPDPGKGKSILENLGENTFILLEENPNKKTKFYKELKSEIEDFPSVMSEDGRLDREAQSKARGIIKHLSKWKGSNELFESVFENSGYSYGITINEIEKIRILFGSEENVSFKEVKEILFGTGRPDAQKIVELIKDSKTKEAIECINDIIEMEMIDDVAMYVFYSLINHYKFIQACVFAKSEGCKTKDKIAELAAPFLGIEDPQKVSNRLYYCMDHVDNTSSDEVSKKIRSVVLAMRDWLAGTDDKQIVMKKLVMSVC